MGGIRAQRFLSDPSTTKYFSYYFIIFQLFIYIPRMTYFAVLSNLLAANAE